MSGADSYLEVGFTSGMLMPGNRLNTASIIRRSDGQSFDESDDHSFIGIITDHVDNPNVTVYYDGVLVAGTEPAPNGMRQANPIEEIRFWNIRSTYFPQSILPKTRNPAF